MEKSDSVFLGKPGTDLMAPNEQKAWLAYAEHIWTKSVDSERKKKLFQVSPSDCPTTGPRALISLRIKGVHSRGGASYQVHLEFF